MAADHDACHYVVYRLLERLYDDAFVYARFPDARFGDLVHSKIDDEKRELSAVFRGAARVHYPRNHFVRGVLGYDYEKLYGWRVERLIGGKQ